MSVSESLSGRYTWIIVTGALGAFGFGWGTGSNDVANAFGTSVGAKTLSLRQAVILAIIFEFTGAIVLGRVSAETIAGGIAKQDTFSSNAPAFAYGMSIVLWLGFLWQAYASYMGWNVSATHSIIGGIIGFAMCWGGPDSVFWAQPDSSKIPPIKGVVPIILSWFISPILTGAASALIYGLNVVFVLKSEHSTARSYYVLPILVFSTVMIDIYFVFTKGAKKSFSASDDWSDQKAAWISAVIASGCCILSAIFGIPLLKRKIRVHVSKREASNAAGLEEAVPSHESVALELMANNKGDQPLGIAISTPVQVVEVSNDMVASKDMIIESSDNAKLDAEGYKANASVEAMDAGFKTEEAKGPSADGGKQWTLRGMSARVKNAALHGVDYDVHKVVEEDPVVAAIHANAKKWDPDTETVYGFLQVVSAICVIFAHGAGEVGYMAGPLAVIYNVASNPGNNVVTTNTKVVPEIWIILISALGLVLGLATYGYKVCEAVGTQMARITPSRGFAAELATSFVIMIAAQFGLPTSSSQCITGGILGIAVFEGSKGVNYKLLLTTMMSWVMTMLVMGFGSALIFSQGIYAPNRFVELRYSKNLTKTYTSLCTEFYNCKANEYLKGCGFKDGDAKTYYTGTCTDCLVSFKDKKCSSTQFLKGCGMLNAGTCTNCTTTKCDSGMTLFNCSGTSPGVCT